LNALGRHLLLELKDCNPEVLNDLDFLKDCLRTAAEEAGATVIADSFHQFTPYGVSGVVIVAESHLFIHTWPEHDYAAVDIFTCGNSVEPRKAAELIIDRLGAKNPSLIELRRGLMEESSVSSKVKS